MLRRAIGLSSTLTLLFIASTHAAAQEATHMVFRYFKCSPEAVGIEMFQNARPVAEEMVAEGRFLDYQLLRHNWGDEWNVVDVVTVSGLPEFFPSFSEWVSRTTAYLEEMGLDEDAPQFNEVCTEHKDNIYTIVDPPSDG